MRRERRKPTRRELDSITSRRPVVGKIPPPDKTNSPGPNEPETIRTGAEPKNFARVSIRNTIKVGEIEEDASGHAPPEDRRHAH